MSFSVRAVAMSVALLASWTTIAPAQSVDGIFGLFGTIIEQDMRRQQQKREEEAEQKEYRLQQEQFRLQEIAFIKRLQAALAELGYYAKAIDGDFGAGTEAALTKFRDAFELPDGDLTVSELERIEGTAQMGFRSAQEVRAAKQGGFPDRDSMIAAMKGGFANQEEYLAGRKAGFERNADFVGFRSSGFEDPIDYKIAREAGFENASDWKRAKAAGFSKRREFDDFVSSGLADRATWLAAKGRLEEIKRTRATCLAAVDEKNDLQILHTCITALALAPGDLSVGQHVVTADAKLALREAQLAAEVTGATEASGLAMQLDAVRQVRAETACSKLMIDEEWLSAAEICTANRKRYPASTALASNATRATVAAAKSEEKRLAAEEMRRKDAEAEQKRLALQEALDGASNLLDIVNAYSSTGNRFSNGLEIARALVQLRAVAGGKDAEPIEQSLLRLSALLKLEPDYQTFVHERSKAEEVAASNAAATALAEARRIDAFIQEFIAMNVTHDSVPDLLEIQRDLADTIASGEAGRLATSQRNAAAKVAALGMEAKLAAFTYTPRSDLAADTAVTKAVNGLAVSKLNELLLTGAEEDIVILNNATPQAPHAVRNLVGTLTFEGGKAVTCWYHEVPERDLATSIAAERVNSAGATDADGATACVPEQLGSTDVVLLRRGEFLRGNILYSKPLVDLLEKGDFAIMSTVLWSEVGERVEAERKLAMEIERDVVAGLRDGFGWIRLENDTRAACMTVSEAVNVHKAILSARAPLAPDLPEALDVKAMSLEKAFYSMQRSQCTVVYAASVDLATLINAAKRDSIPYSVMPVWVSPEEFAGLVDGIKRTAAAETAVLEDARVRKLAEDALSKQKAEARAKLEADKAAAIAAGLPARQAALRETYSQEAMGAFNLLEVSTREFFDASEANNRNGFDSLFPWLATWKSREIGDQWEFLPLSGQILEYGTATWKDRRAEAVFGEFQIPVKNRLLGEKKTHCIVIGYLVDAEFEIFRDPLETTCDESKAMVTKWKTGRDFESRWNVE